MDMKFLPVIVHEYQCTTFKFWSDGQLKDGLRFQRKLYQRVHAYTHNQRDQAYAVAYAFGERKVATVITCSELGYSVWVDLHTTHQEDEMLEEEEVGDLSLLPLVLIER